MKRVFVLTLICATFGFSTLSLAESTTTHTRTTTSRVSGQKPVTGNTHSGAAAQTASGSVSGASGYSDPAAGTSQTYPTGSSEKYGSGTVQGEASNSTWSAYENESDVTTTSAASSERTPAQMEEDRMQGDTGEALAGKQMFFAPKLGVVVPMDLDGYDTAFTYGGEIGFRASRHTTLGINVMSSNNDDVGPAQRDVTITPIMLKWARYPHLQNGAWYGLQAGLVNINGAPGTGNSSNREFGAGLAFGYDYRINPNFSTGLDVNHVTSFGDDIFHLINFTVPFKLHF